MDIHIPTLKSARLSLRAIRADDHELLFALAHDPEVTRHLNEGPPPTEAEVWQRMTLALGQWVLRGYGMMIAEDQDGFVGRLGIYHPYGDADPQLSYILRQRSWGRGYASEGAALIRDWMFVTHRPPRLVSHIAPDNAASARVAGKLGAVRDGATVQAGVTLDIWVHSVPPWAT